MLQRTNANPRIIEDVVSPPKAWHGPDVADASFIVRLTPEVMAELDQVVAEQNKAPVPTIVLEPGHFRLDSAARLMGDVKRRLDDGLGFVILDRLPVDRRR